MSADYRILYNGTPIFINPDLFAAASPVFASYYNPQSHDEMSIKCEAPIEVFRQFLPAVQNMPVTITYENLEALKTMAAQWEVESLLAACQEWENNPCTVIEQLLAANEKKDTKQTQDLADTIAENINEYVSLNKFMLIPSRLIGTIMHSPKLRITDHHQVFKTIFAVVNLRREKCSYLLNYLDVSQLSISEVITLVKGQGIDLNVVGPVMAKCALRLQQSLSEGQSSDHNTRQLERTLRERTNEVRTLERQVKEEIQDHDIVMRKLKEMREKYGVSGGIPMLPPSFMAMAPPGIFRPMGGQEMPGRGNSFMGYRMQASAPVQRFASEPVPAPQPMPQYEIEKPKTKMYIPPDPRDMDVVKSFHVVRAPTMSPLMIEKRTGAPSAVIPNIADDDSDDPFGDN